MPDESPQKVVTEDGRKPREKHPTYDVFRAHGPEGTWVLQRAKVPAPNRREAIVKATIGAANEDIQYGTFAVVRAGEFQVLTRNKKVVTADEWS